MAPGSGNHSRLDLACEPSATGYAVAHARDVLRTWGLTRDAAADAVLIVDELVTNAVRHAGTPAEPDGPERGRGAVRKCGLTLEARDGLLVISVYDETDRLPVLREVSLDAECGRGLRLVAGLCDGNWGCTALGCRPGKLVWARLAIGPLAQDEQPRSLGGQQSAHRTRLPVVRRAGVVA